MKGGMIHRHRWQLVTGSLLVLALGCGSPKGLVPVEGRVTFNGKQPPGNGYVTFVPREMAVKPREDGGKAMPGQAHFGDDGTYRAGTFTPGDGLRPGTYEVRIDCFADAGEKSSANDSHSAPVRSLVPSGFQSPDLVVPPSGGRPVQFVIDVR